MAIKWKNFAEARVATPPSGTSGLTFSVEAGKGLLFPTLDPGLDEYFYGVFTDATYERFEVVKVVERDGDSFTIESGGRGLDATSPQIWMANDFFYYGLTAAALSEIFNFATNPNLVALAMLTSAANKLPYFNGPGSMTMADVDAFGLSILATTSPMQARALISASEAAQLDAPSGTRMLFQQSSAPTGWTKVTDSAYNDVALRVVTGSVSSGGSDAFSDVFSEAKTTEGHALTQAQLPAHTHTGSGTTSSDGAHTHSVSVTYPRANPDDHSGSGVRVSYSSNEPSITLTGTAASNGAHTHNYSFTTSSVGSGSEHSHDIPLAVKYHDVILAVKN